MKRLDMHPLSALLLTVLLLLSSCGGGGDDSVYVDPTGWWELAMTSADMVGPDTFRTFEQGARVGSSFWLAGHEFAIHGATLERVDWWGAEWSLVVVDADSIVGTISGMGPDMPYRFDVEGARSSPPTGELDLLREGVASTIELSSRTAYARVQEIPGLGYEVVLVDCEPMLLTEVTIVHRDPPPGGLVPGADYDLSRSGDVRLDLDRVDAGRKTGDFATAGTVTFATVDATRVVGIVTATMASGGTLTLVFDVPVP